jgi:hypothetical protein
MGEYELVNTLNTLHSKLVVRRKKADCVFEDCTCDLISAGEFAKRLNGYGLVIGAADAGRVVRRYRANLRGDVNWRKFCEDVDSIRTLERPR